MGHAAPISKLLVVTMLAAALVIIAPSRARAEEAVPPETPPAVEVSIPTETPPAVDESVPTEAVPSPAPSVKRNPKFKFTPVHRYDVERNLVFPIVGKTKYFSGFGACRDNCSREHHGVDIMTYGWKGLPVVAAHDGTVTKVTYDEGNPGCSVRIRGRGGWETRYYHLNNDLPGTDQVGAECPVDGIEVGTKVVAGQIIGYVGDSGNAETTAPHLHFELRNRSGYPVDPYRSLRASDKISFEWLPSNIQTSTIMLSKAANAGETSLIWVVSSEEAASLESSETSSTLLGAPLIAVNPRAMQPAINEIMRLAPKRILVMSDVGVPWLEELAQGLAETINPVPIPTSSTLDAEDLPGAVQAQLLAQNPADRFTTIIAGNVDRILRSRVEAYETFTVDHRSVVLASDDRAPTGVGQKSVSKPAKPGDYDSFWWLTGNGWVTRQHADDAPDLGTAYVTERQAHAGTFNYLGTLAEMDATPLWYSPDT